VSLANQIPPFIKPYQALIPLISYKLHSNYPIINPEIGFLLQQQQTTNIEEKNNKWLKIQQLNSLYMQKF
jgi:hypothetical protein